MRYNRGFVMTACLDALDFYAPVSTGDVVTFKARVSTTWAPPRSRSGSRCWPKRRAQVRCATPARPISRSCTWGRTCAPHRVGHSRRRRRSSGGAGRRRWSAASAELERVKRLKQGELEAAGGEASGSCNPGEGERALAGR